MQLPIKKPGPGTWDQGSGKSKAFTDPRSPIPDPLKFLGGYAERVTPVPIPNTEVKPLWADGTARAAVWESRSPPGIKSKAPLPEMEAGLLCFLLS